VAIAGDRHATWPGLAAGLTKAETPAKAGTAEEVARLAESLVRWPWQGAPLAALSAPNLAAPIPGISSDSVSGDGSGGLAQEIGQQADGPSWVSTLPPGWNCNALQVGDAGGCLQAHDRCRLRGQGR